MNERALAALSTRLEEGRGDNARERRSVVVVDVAVAYCSSSTEEEAGLLLSQSRGARPSSGDGEGRKREWP